MKKFIIVDTKIDNYDKYVLCLTQESLLDYLWEVEKELSNEPNRPKEQIVLFDRVFSTGTTSDRFISMKFTNTYFVYKTAQLILANQDFEDKTERLVHNVPTRTEVDRNIIAKSILSVVS